MSYLKPIYPGARCILHDPDRPICEVTVVDFFPGWTEIPADICLFDMASENCWSMEEEVPEIGLPPHRLAVERYLFLIDPDEDIKNEHTEDKPVEVYGY